MLDYEIIIKYQNSYIISSIKKILANFIFDLNIFLFKSITEIRSRQNSDQNIISIQYLYMHMYIL